MEFSRLFSFIFLIIIIIFNLQVENVVGYLIRSLEEFSYSFWNFLIVFGIFKYRSIEFYFLI